MSKKTIENWSVTTSSPFAAPEHQRVCIVGTLKVWNGKSNQEVRTSYIVDAKGKEVTTYSGSVYILGEIDPDYREYVLKIRPNWDPENPIKILS